MPKSENQLNWGTIVNKSCARHGSGRSNMRKSKDEKCIEEVIRNTFNAVQDAYNFQKECFPDLNNPQRRKLSRIVFPKKRNNTTRISEQELRGVFVEQLNNKINEDDWDVYYSIETPTRVAYSGFCKGKKPGQDNDNGRSGEFDLVIFNEKLQRIALIEFKANNASNHNHLKDFVKLNNKKEGDDNVLRYFIEIVKSFDKGTLSNLHGKTEGNEPMFRCWSLDEKKDITTEICVAPIKKKTNNFLQ